MKILVDHEIALKQISRDSANELFNLVQRNLNGSLCYWCPDLKKTYASLESTLAHIDDANFKFEEDGTPDFLIFYKSKLSGLISLSPIDRNRRTSEIGYWLGAEFEGSGIVARSFPFILAYAKNTLQLKAVELSTSVPNVRSQRIPLTFNFQRLKVIPNVETLEGGGVDHILWKYEFLHSLK